MPGVCNRNLRDEWHKQRDQILTLASAKRNKNVELATLLSSCDDHDEGDVNIVLFIYCRLLVI